MGKLTLGELVEGFSKKTEVPGIVILNPGELLFSHIEDRPMSQATWLARPKKNAVNEVYKIDEEYNRVPGHETPEAHIRSVFEHVIPNITRGDVRLYFVGLSDGGEHMLKFLDDKLQENRDHHTTSNMEAVTLIQPTHVPGQLESEAFVNFMATERARSYVSSEKPKGSLLVMPHLRPLTLVDSTASQQGQLGAGLERAGSGSEGSETTARADSTQPAAESANSRHSMDSAISDSYSVLQSPSELAQSVSSLPSQARSLGSGVMVSSCCQPDETFTDYSLGRTSPR